MKAPTLRALALVLIGLGLLALLTIPGVAAQGKDPGDDPTDVSTEIEGLQDAVAGSKTPQRYPRLDSTLNGLVEEYAVGRTSARAAARKAPVHSGSSVAVTIYLNANVAAVRSFLKSNGSGPRNVGEDYIEAYVPVTLLGQLSQQPGVLRVESLVGPQPAGVFPRPLGQNPTPTTVPCLTALGVLSDTATKTETQTGNWDGTCSSDQRSGSYARYFSFTVEQDSSVTIDLTAPDSDSDGDPDTDTYVYLLEGGRDGDEVERNDDGGTDTNAQLKATLKTGDYTVEATTFGSGATGSFTLTIAVSPLNVCTASLGTLAAGDTVTRTGTWSSTCESGNRLGRSAHYYSFTLSQSSTVTIDLTSRATDAYLYVLKGMNWSGDIVTRNDDLNRTSRNARIQYPLQAGDYTVEATTFRSGGTGSFTLSIAVSAFVEIAGRGVDAHGAAAWHQAGITGQGVKVGVLDVGFVGVRSLLGLELPATIHARCYTGIGTFTQDLADCEKDDADEDDVEEYHGTAVAEAVLDVAPDVTLYIANPPSRGDLRAATDWMIAQGVQVINYSVSWLWDGPGDGTSPRSNSPLKSVDAAVAGGILWVNSAGNRANDTWFKRPYRDRNSSNGLVEFGSDDAFNSIVLVAERRARFQLRWADVWGGATRDLDLLLIGRDLPTHANCQGLLTGLPANRGVVACSTREQSGAAGHDPYETFRYTPPKTGVYFLAVRNGNIANLDWIQVQDFTGASRLIEHLTEYGSIGNPAESANPGVLAVGAAPWDDVDDIERFSSRGPTPDGRIKPDLVGADRGTSVTYGPYGFPGTSQAAPHVAGLAALILQLFPALTPARVAAYLKEQAQQRSEPRPDNRDPNNIWGHGFAQLATTLPTAPGPPTITTVTPDDGAIAVAWTAPSNDGGTALMAYDVRSIRSDHPDKADDANWTLEEDAWTSGSGALEYTITSLSGNTQYDVQVRAVNTVTDGDWSATTLAWSLPVTLTATVANPLRVTTTATTAAEATATTPTTLTFGQTDRLELTPTTAAAAELTIARKSADELVVTTTDTTTVTRIGTADSLEFGPSDELTITLPQNRYAATLDFEQSTTLELTLSLTRPRPPPPPQPKPSNGGGGSSGGSRAPSPPPAPPRSPIIGSTLAATAKEVAGDLMVLQRHDQPGVEIEVGIGWISRDGQRIIVIGFVRDGDLGQTYAVVRREGDGRVVRRWIAPDSPLVYAVPWAVVNTQYTFPVGVILAIPLDDQYPWPNMLTRRFDGGDDRILAYDAELGQWRHVPDLATFQARGYYWCNVTAADAGFFDRITLGPPYPSSGVPPRADYPVCQT